MPIQVFEAADDEYLAFGGEAPGRPPTLQEVLVEHQGGGTLLRVVNSGFAEGTEGYDAFEDVDSRWELALATLKHYLERFAGRDRRHSLAMVPAAFAYEQVQPLFTTAAGLGSWLADSARLSAEPLAPGARVEMRLCPEGPLTGEVLARSRRELLLSWEERDAVLGLKCFAMGPRRAVALDWSSWSREAAPQELHPWLEATVARLAARLGPLG